LHKRKFIDPRGAGPIEVFDIMEGGQPNIIDYSNQEPLLFGLGQNSSHEYPGKIVVNNEPERVLKVVDFEVKHDTTGHGTAATGEFSVGHDTTQPTLPTGAPQPYELKETDHNMHGLNFNNKIVWDDTKEDLEESHLPASDPEEIFEKKIENAAEQVYEIVSIPASAAETDCSTCKRTSNDEIILENEEKMEHPGPYELQEAFIEGDHPRAPEGGSQGGQFVSKDGGDDLESQMSLRYKTIIQGKEIDVNLRQKKTWEKHTSEEQRKDPGFNTRYSDELKTQGQGVEKPAEPTAEPTAEPEPTVPEPTAAPGEINKDLYKNLPEDTEKAGEGLKKRVAMFEEFAEKNGRYYEERSTVETQKSQIKYQEDYLASDKGKDLNPAQIKFRQENIDSLKPEIEKHTKNADALESELKAAGKMEYDEVQRYLNSRQTYIDDLERRKNGSMAWYKAQGQVFAHDRVIDEFRTGKKAGHFPGKEAEDYKERVQAARIDANAIAAKEREKKDETKFAKAREENNVAANRLRSKGFEVDEKTGKFSTSPDADPLAFPKNRPSPELDTIKEHQQYLKDYKSTLQNQVDISTLRLNTDLINQGYQSNYDKKYLKESQWKLKNFVDDHSMIGVVMYSDGDGKQAAIYEKKFNTVPMIGRLTVKTISIHKGIGPNKILSASKRSMTMGSWSKADGQVNLFFSSEKYRKKLTSLGMQREDFDLTGDHEFGHSTWAGAKEWISNTDEDSSLSQAMGKFTRTVDTAYDATGDFSLHPYTDSYKRGMAARRHGPDILENEAHSKLREFEVSGDLDIMEKKLTQSQQLVDRHGAPTTTLGLNQVTNDQNKLKMIAAYRELRKEMYAVE